MRALLRAALLVVVTNGMAMAANVDPLACEWAAETQRFTAFDQLPAPVRHDFLGRLHPDPWQPARPIAGRGEPFSATDVIFGKAPPSRRFAGAVGSGDRWLIWYERGGVARSLHFVAYRWREGDAAATLLTHVYADNAALCRDAATVLGGGEIGRPAADAW